MTRDILIKEMGDGNSKSERHLKWTHNRLLRLIGWTWVIIAQFALLPARDQPWDFFGRNDAKAETPALWPPQVKSWLIGKDSDAGRGWGQEEKGMTEDEMAGWHHWLDGRESGWTLGVGDGQGGLACCDSWGCKESDTTEWLNWTESYYDSQYEPITSSGFVA